ncbi:hypothetical protein KHM19_06920 [Leptospira borgpetersenii]|nr:hypothetical protein KHM09_13310 [Leptospira borgpetersenii]GIM21509.1 hypothetical protein KHM19_06920 [Leptospira borgpetersenii]GIM24766.1 hypothetical protein KHM25_06910 [Leptospira borgpetersenii]
MFPNSKLVMALPPWYSSPSSYPHSISVDSERIAIRTAPIWQFLEEQNFSLGVQVCVDKKTRNKMTRKIFPDKKSKKIRVGKTKREFKLILNLEY